MRPKRLPAALALVAALAGLSLLAGCGGGGGTEAPEHPFGSPPAAAAGIHAWAAGESGDLLVTSDGGATWRRQKFFLPQRAVDVTFSDPQTGWLVTNAGTVLATADGGAGWTVVEKVKLDVKAIAATDYRTAWIAGNAVGAAGEPGVSPSSAPPTAARRGRGPRSATPCWPTSPSPTAGTACSSRWTGSGAPGTAAAPGVCASSSP